jgi:hypothetical protein
VSQKLILIFEVMASAETEIKSPSVPLFQRGKFNCASVHSLNFAEPVPLFEKEGPGEIYS